MCLERTVAFTLLRSFRKGSVIVPGGSLKVTLRALNIEPCDSHPQGYSNGTAIALYSKAALWYIHMGTTLGLSFPGQSLVVEYRMCRMAL
jgi:hypothetical protein